MRWNRGRCWWWRLDRVECARARRRALTPTHTRTKTALLCTRKTNKYDRCYVDLSLSLAILTEISCSPFLFVTSTHPLTPTPSPMSSPPWLAKIEQNDPAFTALYVMPFRPLSQPDLQLLFRTIHHSANTRLLELCASGKHLDRPSVVELAAMVVHRWRQRAPLHKLSVGDAVPITDSTNTGDINDASSLSPLSPPLPESFVEIFLDECRQLLLPVAVAGDDDRRAPGSVDDDEDQPWHLPLLHDWDISGKDLSAATLHAFARFAAATSATTTNTATATACRFRTLDISHNPRLHVDPTASSLAASSTALSLAAAWGSLFRLVECVDLSGVPFSMAIVHGLLGSLDCDDAGGPHKGGTVKEIIWHDLDLSAVPASEREQLGVVLAQLERVYLTGCGGGDDGDGDMNNRKLNPLGDAVVKGLVAGVGIGRPSRSLHTLYLDRLGISAEHGLRGLGDLLRRDGCPVTSLHLANNGIRSLDALLLLPLLPLPPSPSPSPSLSPLPLSGDGDHDHPLSHPRHHRDVEEVKFGSLRQLVLNGNPLEERAVHRLLGSTRFPALEELHLLKCDIRSVGWELGGERLSVPQSPPSPSSTTTTMDDGPTPPKPTLTTTPTPPPMPALSKLELSCNRFHEQGIHGLRHYVQRVVAPTTIRTIGLGGQRPDDPTLDMDPILEAFERALLPANITVTWKMK